MEISGKNIIVTGAAGGIGSSITKNLLENNAVVAAVSINKDKLNLLKDRCSTMADNLICYCGDVGDIEFVKNVTEDFLNHYNKIDILINNASILLDAPLIGISKGKLRKLPLENWNKTIASNLTGVFYFSREVAEKMFMKRTKGLIINVSSISSVGNSGQTAYAAAKAGVNALTVTWASELSLFGIRVAGIAPGLIDTEMPRKAMTEKNLSKWINKSLVKRLGLPEEVAQGIVFIIQNDFFSGRILEIDGGLRL